MQVGRSAADQADMSPTTPLATVTDQPMALRVHRGEDAVELQRRLEAFLLIARRVSPELRLSAA
jgi:hypothetical protein